MISCIVAVAQGKEKLAFEASNTFALREPDGVQFVHKHLIAIHESGIKLDLIATLIVSGVDIGTQSEASGGLWDLYLLLPDSLDQTVLPKAFRRLLRIQPRQPKLLRGPWSPKEFSKKFASLGNSHLKGQEVDVNGNPTGPKAGAPLRIPHCLAGSDPVAIATVDYRPTAQEVTDDTDPDFSVLFSPK